MSLLTPDVVARVKAAVRSERLLDTAMALVDTPSPTQSCRAVHDRFAAILQREGFAVSRPECNWEEAPAVVARYDTGRPGKTLQFNGHLDTVHLPFSPAKIVDGVLTGSGASDMKGGIAAMVEATRALKDAGLLPSGGILVTAHDHHEMPWGDGRQINGLVDEGYLGDGVLLPEYCADRVPLVSRGMVITTVTFRRPGVPVHEVAGGAEAPSVIAAGADLVRRLRELDQRISTKTHPLGVRESAFVGQFAAGEIYNQAPVECRVAGTRRWLPGTSYDDVAAELRGIYADVARETGTSVDAELCLVRDACELDPADPLVTAFDAAYRAHAGTVLPRGAKPFVDDGNTFIARGGVPALTHGPNCTGAHTVNERVPISELVRVAEVYALTAIAFCGG